MSDDQNDSDVSFFDIFDPNTPRSDQDIVESRLKICNSCPAFRKNTKRCSKCGCFMKIKATLLDAKCPIGTW